MPRFKAKYTAGERKAFGNLLRRLMAEKGLNGAELARQANLHIPTGGGLDRSAISWYVNGRSVPTPVSLHGIAKALNVDAAMLLPRSHAQAPSDVGMPPATKDRDVRMALLPGGEMHLMMNIHVPADTGWSILKLLEGGEPSKPRT